MRCERPYVSIGQAFPCGVCLPCRLNRRRVWTHRILLERTQHKDACFLTLTYRTSSVRLTSTPTGLAATGMGLPTLRPKDLQDWLKRFRKAMLPFKIRFYGCGEYGEQTHRPHYHVIVFGCPPCSKDATVYTGTGEDAAPSCCANCNLIHSTWGHGRIYNGHVTHHSAQYVGGYTVKKLTVRDEDVAASGRHPEFQRMSLRPGIGLCAMYDLASEMLRFNLETRQEDVPVFLSYGKNKKLPLGRYLRRNLRKFIGRDEKTPEQIVARLQAEMLSLRLDSRQDKDGVSFKKKVIEASEGEVRNVKSQYQLYGRKKGRL